MIFQYVLAVVGVVLGISLLLGRRVTRRGKPQAADSPANYGLKFSEIAFQTADRVTLHGWWIPSDQSPRTIIFLHGYHGSMDYDLPLVSSFNQHGFNVMMFDFRGHNRSEGRLTTIGALERKDASAAIALAQAKGSIWIGLLGFSMGGRVAILSAADGAQINAVVSDCAPARLTTAIAGELVKRHIPIFAARICARLAVFGASILSGTNLFIHEPILQAAKLGGKPVYFIQGMKDPFITQDEFSRMTLCAGENARTWMVPDAGHCEIPLLLPEEYRLKIIEFFAQNL